MAVEKKATIKLDKLTGRARENIGKLTGDKGTEARGKLEQAKADVESAAHKIWHALS